MRACHQCLSPHLHELALACVHARFIVGTISTLMAEVDIVIMGLKLINELVDPLSSHRNNLFEVVLNCIQVSLR